MEKFTYTWKNLERNTYVDIGSTVETTEYSSSPLGVLKDSFDDSISTFYRFYDKLIIPKETEAILISLLEKYQLSEHKNDFFSLACACQKSYMDNYETELDKFTSDFNTTKADWRDFLEILERYLYAENKKNLHSISFKFNTSPTTTVNNFFVVDEIYDAICAGLGLTKANFQDRKEEILSSTNQLKVELHGEYTKTNIIKPLYEFIHTEDISQNYTLQFIGAFLHICQIPVNNKDSEIELDDDIDLLLKSIDTKNLAHYIKRPKNFLHL